MQPEKPEIIARNAERVLTARLRDARFFYDADRQAPLESRIDRLATVLFHKKLGSYERRRSAWRGWPAGSPARRWASRDAAAAAEQRRAPVQGGSRHRHGARADRAPGHDGRHLRARGRDARADVEGHLLPLPAGGRRSRRAAVEGAAGRGRPWSGPPCRWPTSFDSVVGMYAAGERPTGSRDPLGLRRHAQGAVKILADLPELTGLDRRVTLGRLLEQAGAPFDGVAEAAAPRPGLRRRTGWRICSSSVASTCGASAR